MKPRNHKLVIRPQLLLKLLLALPYAGTYGADDEQWRQAAWIQSAYTSVPQTTVNPNGAIQPIDEQQHLEFAKLDPWMQAKAAEAYRPKVNTTQSANARNQSQQELDLEKIATHSRVERSDWIQAEAEGVWSKPAFSAANQCQQRLSRNLQFWLSSLRKIARK